MMRFIKRAIIAVILAVIITNVVVHLKAKPYIYKEVKDIPAMETAVILGAGLYENGNLSPLFRDRVDKAVELYNAGKVSKILASGDNSTVAHNEVEPVRDYLIAHGVSAENIFLDHAGFDTYSTMYRARDIFEVNGIIVVTQEFHLPRAIFIARALGLDAQGVSAGGADVAPARNYVREVFANEKAVMDLILHRKPKFLGDTIPISDNGNI